MLLACLVFVAFDILGEWLQRRFALPIPGALIGLTLLTICLCLRPQLAGPRLRSGARMLLGGMSMFFVPAGTGVITQLHRIRVEWIPIVVALSVSTVASLIAAAWTMGALDRLFAPWLFTPPRTESPAE